MTIRNSVVILLCLFHFSCSVECIETENFYEVPLKCEIIPVIGTSEIKVLQVFNSDKEEIESSIKDNSFEVIPWNSAKTNKKINYDTTFYLKVQNLDLTTELDSINFLYNVETDDCGTYVIKQMRFQYNGRTNFTGTFNNNVCSFTFLKN